MPCQVFSVKNAKDRPFFEVTMILMCYLDAVPNATFVACGLVCINNS